MTARILLRYGLVGAAAGIAFSVVCGFLPVASWLGAPLVVVDTIHAVDAIVVLGAGTYDETTLNPASAYRLLRGVQLLQAGHASVLILSGGTHRGTRISDASAMADVASGLGVDRSSMILDETSVTTWQQASAVARLVRGRRIRSVALVTSPLHSYRASLTFRRAGLDVISAPAAPTFDSRLLTVGEDHFAGRLSVVMQASYEYVAIAAYRLRSAVGDVR